MATEVAYHARGKVHLPVVALQDIEDTNAIQPTC
jgi:hypothetical protein